MTANGFKDATADELAICRWWKQWPRANIGLPVPHGYAILDVDGQAGLDALKAAGHGVTPTAVAKTGNGWHYWYKTLDDLAPRVGILEKVDIRGPGSYVVAPPSLHVSGRQYEWLTPLEAISAAPDWLEELAGRRNGRDAGREPTGETIGEGTRNATLTSLGGSMRRRGMSRSEIVAALRVVNSERCRPPLPDAEVERIASSIGRYEPDEDAAPQSAMPVEPRTLADVHFMFQRWLSLPDVGVVDVNLGAYAANRQPGDPCWLMNVSGPSSGKTEVLQAFAGLPDVRVAATLTVSALLSGTPKREKDKAAKGGLLREIGDFGVLLLKDFTSILSMHRDPRGELLAALRECYDGAWTRHVGVDGGRTLHWQGKLGLLGACTTAIDTHHAVMALMGERFLLYRLPTVDAADQARRALANNGREAEMRRELADAVRGLFAATPIPDAPEPVTAAEIDRFIALASLVARARSAVDRDGYKREIDLIADPEAPARIAQALRRLFGGMVAIGVERAEAWRLVVKVGLDCLPKLRRTIFDVLLDATDWQTTRAVGDATQYPTTTAQRTLEDLTVHGVVERQDAEAVNRWRLTDWARERYLAATSPEKSVG